METEVTPVSQSPFSVSAIVPHSVMPAIFRKLIIFTSTHGLIIQTHGGADHNDCLRIDFKTRTIARHEKVELETFKQSQHLESHGIIGGQLPLSSTLQIVGFKRH